MIKYFLITETDIQECSREEANWIDVFYPNADEIDDICNYFSIEKEHIKSCLDIQERSKVLEHERYSFIIYRVPLVNTEVRATTLGIFIKSDVSEGATGNAKYITVHEDNLKFIDDMVQDRRMKQLVNPENFVFWLLNSVNMEYFRIMDDIEDKIDQLEDEVIEKPRKKNIQDIFAIKKALAYFHKSFNGNREVLSAIQRNYLSKVKSDVHLTGLYDDVNQLVDMEATYRDIVTSVLDVYMSSISNNLNRVMKVLTIITALILPPTLIAGIYGMNLPIPYADRIEAFWFSIVLMIISVALMFFWFRRKKWI